MKTIRTRNLSGKVPIQTFEICHKCGLVALTPQEVETMIGYRHTGGKRITQANCHSCRAVLGASPTRRTDPNKNKISRDLIRYYFSSLPALLFMPVPVRLPVLPATATFCFCMPDVLACPTLILRRRRGWCVILVYPIHAHLPPCLHRRVSRVCQAFSCLVHIVSQ